jgi:hypothetical protein
MSLLFPIACPPIMFFDHPPCPFIPPADSLLPPSCSVPPPMLLPLLVANHGGPHTLTVTYKDFRTHTNTHTHTHTHARARARAGAGGVHVSAPAHAHTQRSIQIHTHKRPPPRRKNLTPSPPLSRSCQGSVSWGHLLTSISQPCITLLKMPQCMAARASHPQWHSCARCCCSNPS